MGRKMAAEVYSSPYSVSLNISEKNGRRSGKPDEYLMCSFEISGYATKYSP